jgi:hypothetical protein
MNQPRGREIERALLKRCPFCDGYVQGRGETFQEARISLRSAMVQHVEDGHWDQEQSVV